MSRISSFKMFHLLFAITRIPKTFKSFTNFTMEIIKNSISRNYRLTRPTAARTRGKTFLANALQKFGTAYLQVGLL